MTSTPQIAVAVPLALLQSRTITVLADSFQAAFMAAYGEEKERKQAAKRRLLAELHAVEPMANRTDHEEYSPE